MSDYPVSRNPRRAAGVSFLAAALHPYSWSDTSRKLAQRVDAINHAKDIASGHPPRALLLFQGVDDAVIAPNGAVSLDL
jgi:hypothetical protein